MFFLTTALICKTKLLPPVKEGCYLTLFVYEGEMISKMFILIEGSI